MSEKREQLGAHQVLREAIQNVAVGPDRGRDITSSDAKQISEAMLDGVLDPLQIAVFLIALRMKRESIEEMEGLFKGLITHCQQQTLNSEHVICLADPFDGYGRHTSITAFIAPTLAACGLKAVMHGVKSVGPKHGVTAHQIYQLAGINPLESQASVADNVDQLGWGYIDQQVYAPALHTLGDLRDRMIKRTALTTLERVLMPFRGRSHTHLVLGYVHKAYPEIYLRMAQIAGYSSATLLKGVEGGLAPALNKPIRRFYHNELAEFDGLPEKQVVELPNWTSQQKQAAVRSVQVDAQQSLQQGRQVLSGEAGIARDSLCLSVANILYAHNHSNSLTEAVEKVQDCLDNGSAMACFSDLCDSV